MDSGCSKHMSRQKSMFLTWKPIDKGNVTFGNNTPGKINARGVVSLSNGKGKEKMSYMLIS